MSRTARKVYFVAHGMFNKVRTLEVFPQGSYFFVLFFALICTFNGAPNAIFAKQSLILNTVYFEAKGGADEWMKDLRTL